MENTESKLDGMESSKSKSDDHFMHGWHETNTRTTWATRCVEKWVIMTTQTKHELTRRQRAHSLVKCRVSCAWCWSWFSRCHWCRTSYRSVSPRQRNSKFFFFMVKSNCVLSSSTQTVPIILACCSSRKRVLWGVVLTDDVCLSFTLAHPPCIEELRLYGMREIRSFLFTNCPLVCLHASIFLPLTTGTRLDCLHTNQHSRTNSSKTIWASCDSTRPSLSMDQMGVHHRKM